MQNTNSALNLEFDEEDMEAVQEKTSPENAKTGARQEKPTPMMAQFLDIKAQYTDCLLFYRMGDFYELFFDDAIKAAEALGITLTKRGKHLGEDIPMCGVPVRASYDYLERLIKQGFRVAICEQMEDPAEAKKRGHKAVVKRDVVRLVTAGTLTEERLLDHNSHNYLMSIASVKAVEGWVSSAWLDISTGDFYVSDVPLEGLPALIARLEPGEIILPSTLFERADLRSLWLEHDRALMPLDKNYFDGAQAERKIKSLFQVSALDAYGEFSRGQISACGALADYVALTQKTALPSIKPPRIETADADMQIDAATRRNLEITRNMNGGPDGTLLAALDQTITSFGARELKKRLSSPSTSRHVIHDRLDGVAYFIAKPELREFLRQQLKSISDIERCLSRISLGRGSPRDLKALQVSLSVIGEIRTGFNVPEENLPTGLHASLAKLSSPDNGLLEHLAKALGDDVPLQARDGGFVRAGYREELDIVRDLRDSSKKIIAELQATYAEKTGVKNLKVKHNNVLGYFIEVTSQNADTLQEDRSLFIHRQTLANNMRFTTTELASLEERIRSAADKALSMELQIFDEMVEAVKMQTETLMAYATSLANLDVASSLAEVAEEESFCRPIVDETSAFVITAGRHLVVEQALRKLAEHEFVPNSVNLSREADRPAAEETESEKAAKGKFLWVLTGPNMAGKSTFLRQNALIAILAQAGSYVPASYAHIGIIDKLFSRVGASDDLARGRSTFMVEMIETATILNQATEKSLVILDEIGRGTSTYDGLSIAWACLEHLHEVNKCRSIFATHFHELTALSTTLSHQGNVVMKVKEWEGEVIFLHEVAMGTAAGSYGIQVAKLAGLPADVLHRATEVLAHLEASETAKGHTAIIDELPLFSAKSSLKQSVSSGDQEILTALNKIAPDDMSPLEALEFLYELKSMGHKKN